MEMVKHYEGCVSFGPKRRWFECVWTRQEALYARRIRIVHAGGFSTSCTKLDEDQPGTNVLVREIRNVLANTAEVVGTKLNSPDMLDETSAVRIAQMLIAEVAFLH